MPSLSQANTVVILSSAATTLLLLRNSQIPLHQSLNLVLSLLNHSGSGTMFFVGLFSLCITSTDTVNISSISGIAGSMLWFDLLFSMILNDPSISSNASIVSVLCSAILTVCDFFTIPFLQGEPDDALLNVITLDLAQVAT